VPGGVSARSLRSIRRVLERASGPGGGGPSVMSAPSLVARNCCPAADDTHARASGLGRQIARQGQHEGILMPAAGLPVLLTSYAGARGA
jgi:hypothetical protein